MSKTAFYIHYTGEWLGFEGPEEPSVLQQGNEYDIIGLGIPELSDYNQAITEAAKNSLKILNPEVLKIGDLQDNGAFIFPAEVKKGKYYQWPGAYRVHMSDGWQPSYNNPDNSGCEYPAEPNGWILTPTAALEEESQFNQWDSKSKTIVMEEEYLRNKVKVLVDALKLAYSPSVSIEDWMRNKEDAQKLIESVWIQYSITRKQQTK